MSQVGRNDPCPCGSGKKYKRCCYGKETPPCETVEAATRDPEWQKIRRTEAGVVDAVLGFAKQRHGETVVAEAWEEFTFGAERSYEDPHFETVFIPWFVFNWIRAGSEKGIAGAISQGEPLALAYLREYAARLDAYNERFIRAVCRQPFSFFVVTEVAAARRLGLRDLFLQRTITVKEVSASKILRRGDILYCRVLPLDGQAIIVGAAPVVIPPNWHVRFLDFRDDLRKVARKAGFELDPEFLCNADAQMREIYWDVEKASLNPPVPKLQNTDGDPLAFVKLHFRLHCSPQEALDRLKTLSLPEFRQDILQDAVYDAGKNLLQVGFAWQRKGNKAHKHWDNTVLGHLSISGNRLTAEVNSEKRAEKIQSEIRKRLGDSAVFERALHENVERKLEKMKDRSGAETSSRAQTGSEALESSPEFQAEMKEFMKAHWEAGLDQPIPALGNKTPRESARSASCRERLEALLLEFERHNERLVQPFLRADLEDIRGKLGL